ncbi:MAG: 1-phosphofructokinase family hexose kinase [Propionibacteriaceae bacterium]|jgi:1-phosphofructokinase
MIVTLTPNPSLDRTLFLDTFTRGAVNRCTATLAEPSGKGINVALALHKHGVPVLAVLPVGGPAGEQLIQLLDATGLAYRAVTITGTIRTNVSMIEADGTSSKINEPGPTLTSEEVADLVRTTLDSCSAADWLAMCGTLPNGFSVRHVVQAVHAARTAGLRVAMDSSGSTLQAVLSAAPQLVKPNAHELAEVTGRVINTIGDVIAAAEQLRVNRLGTVLVSLGRDGAVLVDGNGALHGRTAAVTAINTVGAGDAFLAGYLAADANESLPADRLASAVRWGVTAVQHHGTLLPRVDDRIPVRVTAADPNVTLSEPATP